MRVLSQGTPNPDALRFITEKDLKDIGKVTIRSKEECLTTPLAVALFDLPGVKQLYFFENSVTVNKDHAVSWEELEPQVIRQIEELAADHDPTFTIINQQTPQPILEGPLKEINEILDRTIRPGLQGDGGDLDIVSLEGKILTVSYQGACTNCPSAISGTLMAIESILKDEYDPELEVVSV